MHQFSWLSYFLTDGKTPLKLTASLWFSVSFVLLQTVVLKVSMSCEGCAGAVRRVLGKMEGSISFIVISQYHCLSCFVIGSKRVFFVCRII